MSEECFLFPEVLAFCSRYLGDRGAARRMKIFYTSASLYAGVATVLNIIRCHYFSTYLLSFKFINYQTDKNVTVTSRSMLLAYLSSIGMTKIK